MRRVPPCRFFSSLFMLFFLAIGFSACSSQADQNIFIQKDDTSVIKQAFSNRQSDIFVTASGLVEKILPDDNVGSRHQRFIVRLSNGQTVLVAHNIDIAPRVDNISVGDYVTFHGEYEYNEKGGAIHWTHRDPSGRRFGGWIKHNGQRYR